jgi:hypothetical protein
MRPIASLRTIAIKTATDLSFSPHSKCATLKCSINLKVEF